MIFIHPKCPGVAPWGALGHGGGTIKRKKTTKLILALAIFICFISTSAALDGQTNENTDSKVVSTEKIPVVTGGENNYPTVNAAQLRSYKRTFRRTPVRSYKRTYSKVRYSYKMVKVGNKWKRVRYVIRYASTRPAAAPAPSGPVIDAPMERCMVPTRNCQVDDPSIQALANELTTPPPANETNTTVEPYSNYQKAYNIYEWTEKNVEYSWYYNTQKGATGVLSQRTANCCDMSHMIVALSRAAGLPARYRHGICTFVSGTFGHVWADIYVDGNWIPADASNNDNDFGVIRNWNTNSWSLKGIYAELPF